MLRKKIKQLFIKTGNQPALDKMAYALSFLKHYRKNRSFRKTNPGFTMPPDYFLYETYRLDYELYRQDGEVAAREICEWTMKYIPHHNLSIMEWGCGVGRIIRHVPRYGGTSLQLTGCDINQEMINWDQQNIPNIRFDTIQYLPPTQYPASQYDIIYALSVFTHIEKEQQPAWIDEIARLLKPNGVFLFTTHGKKYFDQLSKEDHTSLLSEGAFTESYKQKGHRMMATYNTHDWFCQQLADHFNILEFYEGQEHEYKVGGQDLWIVQKK